MQASNLPERAYEVLDLLLEDLAELGTSYEDVKANTNFSNVTFPLLFIAGAGPTFRLATFTEDFGRAGHRAKGGSGVRKGLEDAASRRAVESP